MSDNKKANFFEQATESQPSRVVVTRDPVTKEFIHTRVPINARADLPLPFAPDQVKYDAGDHQYFTDNEAILPVRASKKRLRRQRIGHSIVLAAVLSGTYTAGNYALTGFNTGKAPNIIEDVTQLPADFGNTIESAQSFVNSFNQLKQFIPENGDK